MFGNPSFLNGLTLEMVDLGYESKESLSEDTHVLMGDGAYSRCDVGDKIGIHTPPQRFQDGDQLDVNQLYVLVS